MNNNNQPNMYMKFDDDDKSSEMVQFDNNEETEQTFQQVKQKMICVSIVCTILMILELIGGYLASSLAIMSDAAHLLSDLLGFQISIFSIYLAQKKATKLFSFGYHRAEIIGALCSVIVIWVLTIWLVIEAYDRIKNLDKLKIDARIMLITSILGLLANLVMGKVLHSHGSHGHSHAGGGHGHSHGGDHSHSLNDRKSHHSHNERKSQQKSLNNNHAHSHDNNQHGHSHDNNQHGHSHDNNNNNNKKQLTAEQIEAAVQENYNIRAAYIHILGDTLQSVGVILAAVIIYFNQNLKIVDPICTLIFSVIVVFTTVPVTKDCLMVLMEASPVGINTDKLLEEMKQIQDVVEVHDLHVWSLASGKPCLSAHIISLNPSKTLRKATRLCRRFKISHSTLQVEGAKDRKISCISNIH